MSEEQQPYHSSDNSSEPSQPPSAPAKPLESKQPLPEAGEDKPSPLEAKTAAMPAPLDDKQAYQQPFPISPKNAQKMLVRAVRQDDYPAVDALLESGALPDGEILLKAIKLSHSKIFWRLLRKANVEIEYGGHSLAEWIALSCPWSPLEKQQALKKLDKMGVKLTNYIFAIAVHGGEGEFAEIIKTKLHVKDRHGYSIIHYWAANNQTKALAEIARDTLLAARDRYGVTALMIAAENAHIEAAMILFEKGAAPVNAQTGSGRTALHMAAFEGHLGMVKLLLEKGARIDARSKDGDTALLVAASAGHVEVVRLLLERDADVDASDKEGCTPLQWAAGNGYEAVVRLLLQRGANIHLQAKNGGTALYEAAGNGDVGMIQILLEAGVAVNIRDKSIPLLQAALNGHREAVRLLLERGANINLQDADGMTALHLTAKKNHFEVVELLLQRKADINVQSKNGRTALHEAASHGNVRVVHAFLQNKAAINAQDEQDATALHLATEGGHLEVIQLLERSGARMNQYNFQGLTPLISAAHHGHLEVVKWLLQKDNILLGGLCSYGGELLRHAAFSDNRDLVFWLVRNYDDADITEMDESGRGVMEWATHFGAREASFQLAMLQDLRAEYYRNRLTGILEDLIAPPVRLVFPMALIQMIIDYFSPYTPAEYKSFHESVQKTREKFHQNVRAFAEDTVWLGWPRSKEEKELASDLNEQLNPKQLVILTKKNIRAGFLKAREQARLFLSEHKHSAKLKPDGYLLETLHNFAGATPLKEEIKRRKEEAKLSPLALISRSALPVRQEEKAPKAVVREKKEEAPAPVVAVEPAVSAALRRRLASHLPLPTPDPVVLPEKDEIEVSSNGQKNGVG